MRTEEEPKFVTVNIESATGEDLGKVSYIPLPNVDYVPKQETTLEEAAKKYCLINNIPTDQMIVKTDRSCEFETPVTMFNNGAKWQQEQDNKELSMWKLAVEKQEARCKALNSVISDLQERMYSEEDMIEFAEFVATYPDKNKNINGQILHAKSKYDGAERTIDLLAKWFEQFKKK